MTLRMLDSITPANLPPGADAYLGYVDGHWANAAAVKAKFPGKPVLTMAVFASSDAEGADCETGDMMPAQIPGWVKRQAARGVHRPVVYASASVIPAVLAALTGAGIARADVRLLSAHYSTRHICGPATCAYPGVPACDGTQWRDNAPGAGGSQVDESALLDDFFQEAPMAISAADLAAIAHAVWTTDGLIANPNGNPKNPFWTGAEVAADTGQRVRAVQTSLAALVGQDDPAALAKAILAGLDAASIAAAVAAAVGPDVAREVVTALAAQLGK
jgi:hypothetical protein